ncbi:DNA-binding response regulator [Pandoraea iniqua]|uniref:DNA-binding response regulator n=1 Tax=Pandoraea iniqua TaxID=2508288 RepID=A0A5E4V8M2_9BURK|nr:heavy metal response regulator transcription factor [Pandoraea iniqua]VVE07944.1 DNA-binding response regulator [Pandoraea iniqua]VVE34969.1 DNA-binding response regulator [Pandoraea iniqua]
MRILVVEDEHKTGQYLKKGLTEAGYVVDLAVDGVDGLHMATTLAYDLVVLDVMLPGKDGWQVLAELRTRRHTPVLFLTARDDLDERIKGLDLGADDYMTKPFAFAELLARVRTLLRRGRTREPDVLQIGDLELNLLGHKAVRQGTSITLTAKEFLLLALLMRRHGEILPRSLIASQVWDVNFDSDTNIVDVTMRRLRAKIDDPFATKMIHTVRGMGYVLELREPRES